MPQKKKQLKKTQTKKLKAGGHGPEKLGIDPTLKPIVVKTKGGSKEEQEDNPLNRKAMYVQGEDYGLLKLPEGFKTADNLTEKDDLEFECGRLREMLVTWLDRQVIDGVPYQVLVDPMNRVVQIMREP